MISKKRIEDIERIDPEGKYHKQAILNLAQELKIKSINYDLSVFDEITKPEELFYKTREVLKVMSDVYNQPLMYDLVKRHIENINIFESNNFKQLQFDIYELYAIKKNGEAIELMVKFILENETIRATRNDRGSEIWVYANGIYRANGRTVIREYVRKMLNNAYTIQTANKVTDRIEADNYIDEKDFFINEDINLVPLENGIYHMKKKKLIEYDPKYIFFSKINAYYNPECECQEIKKYLNNTLKPSDITVIQELFGYFLLREYRYPKAFILNGKGSNGKSTLLDICKTFLGEDNITNLSLQQLDDKGSKITCELFGRLANLGSEIGTETLEASNFFKQLTGNDTVMTDRKFLNPIKFKSFAKMVFSANEIPKTKDLSDGFMRRWIFVDFPYQFFSQYEIDAMPEHEKKNCKLADRQVLKKCLSDAELSGLLNWAIEGLERLQEKKDFTTNQTTADIRKIWKIRSDNVVAFLDEYVESDLNYAITKQSLKAEYKKFCVYNKIRPVSEKAFQNTLYQETFAESKRKLKKDQYDEYYWHGIKFKNADWKELDGIKYSYITEDSISWMFPNQQYNDEENINWKKTEPTHHKCKSCGIKVLDGLKWMHNNSWYCEVCKDEIRGESV